MKDWHHCPGYLMGWKQGTMATLLRGFNDVGVLKTMNISGPRTRELDKKKKKKKKKTGVVTFF
jgi:hypothetical protein